MLEIKDYEVFGLERAIIASGLPMTTSNEPTYSKKRAEVLGNSPTGSGHSNFLKGILVTARVKYPLYWTKQFQRYHHAEIVSSQSTMWRITKMNMDTQFNEFTLPASIKIMKNLINSYNTMLENKEEFISIDELGVKVSQSSNLKVFSRKELYNIIVSTCPCGLEMEMEFTTNYLQLKTIYEQRRNHKLEDWHVFCEWIETLPMFKELCLTNK